VAYRPRPVPGSDAFTEASKKRKADAARKALVKRPRASRKKKGESVKVAASWENTSLKQPSDAEVASARPVKLSKKIVPRPTAATSTTTTHIAVGASGPKGVIGASGSKGVASALGSKGATSAKKAITPVQKHCVPTIGVMEEASLIESHESSPHGQTPWDYAPKFVLWPETHS
jgi:hypothetical protein